MTSRKPKLSSICTDIDYCGELWYGPQDPHVFGSRSDALPEEAWRQPRTRRMCIIFSALKKV